MSSETHPTIRTYAWVFIALMILLTMTVGFAFIDFDKILPGLSTTVAIGIAIAKALLVIIFFMDLKYGEKLVWGFAGAGFLWFALMISMTLSDYHTRHVPPGTNPRGEPRFLQPPPVK
jgi:cytochrome c oxidase subunit 4